MMLTAVQKSVTVEVAQARAFAFFVEHTWWPMDGHRIDERSTGAAIEPREGGRWYEFGGPDGECDWGRVIAYEPPERLVLAWQLNARWEFDPDFVSEVEIRFIAESPARTRVELEHRDMEKFGPEVRASFDGENGWNGVLAAYAASAGSM